MNKKFATVAKAARYIIALVLVVSGIGKVINPSPTIEILGQAPHFPDWMIISVVSILPVVEIALAIALVIRYRENVNLLLCLGLFVGFFAFSIYCTLYGMNSDCGCFGAIFESRIGWKMVLRNFLFVLMVGLMVYQNKNETIPLLDKAEKYLNDPNLFISLGNCYKETGNFDGSEYYYQKAGAIVPHQMYPKYLLVKLYEKYQRNEQMLRLAEEISEMAVKIPSVAVTQIKREIDIILEKNDRNFVPR